MIAKGPYEVKYQLLINKYESADLKHFEDPKDFIKSSNDIDDIQFLIFYFEISKRLCLC